MSQHLPALDAIVAGDLENLGGPLVALAAGYFPCNFLFFFVSRFKKVHIDYVRIIALLLYL
jgi:hypothetical protein